MVSGSFYKLVELEFRQSGSLQACREFSKGRVPSILPRAQDVLADERPPVCCGTTAYFFGTLETRPLVRNCRFVGEFMAALEGRPLSHTQKLLF